MKDDGRSHDRVEAVTGIRPEGSFDHAKIRDAVRMMFEAIGIDPEGDGVRDTPARVARMFDEIYGGLLVNPVDVVSAQFDEGHDDLILVRDIAFHSVCEHHLVPWFGHAHVGYLPGADGRITGLSKLARLVDVCAKRPGVQERMTTMVADALDEVLQPRGVIVVIEARHLCMEMRGIRKPGAETITSTVRGIFREDPRTRAEAMALVTGRR